MSVRLLRSASALVAAALLVALPSAALAHGGSDDESHRPPATQGHTSKLADLREATAAYASGPAAPWSTKVEDKDQITCIEDPNHTGTMGVHYADLGNLFDGKVNRLAPEALIYEPGSDGSQTLIAVEYLVFADVWDATHAGPPILYGQKFALVEAGNRYGLPAFYELHVWHEKANPNGIFNDWNPNVHCPPE